MMKPIVIGISGASGTIYGIRLIEELLKRGREVYVIPSATGKEILDMEVPDWREKIKGSKICESMGCETSSGSFIFESMVVAPCTINTLSKLANGISDDPLTRAAMVAIKEKRKLILLVREMPWPPQAFYNAHLLSTYGVAVVPASPAFYFKPETVDELINFVVGRILDLLGIENDLYMRWEDVRKISEGSN